MPKVPYKSEKSKEEDDDYEIVSFEDFCDKSPGSKTDLLTLNDNINYRLCYESDKGSKFEYGGEGSRDAEKQTETSLSGGKNVTFKRKLSGSFAPFGRYNGKTHKGSLFSGVIPKARSDTETGSREHRYQRFSADRSVLQCIWDNLPGVGMLSITVICLLCVGVWWAVGGAVGGAWGEEHYRRLWERAHPDTINKPLTPVVLDKAMPEYRYHDHNNLSTKNKSNATDLTRKKLEANKKSYLDMSPEQLAEVCHNLPDDMKFDCAPDGSQASCESRGCCWVPVNSTGVPYCFYPPYYKPVYRFVNMTENKHGITVLYQQQRKSGYPKDFEYAVLQFVYLSNEKLMIKIYNKENRRFEIPVPEIPMVPGPLSDMQYRVEVDSTSVGFRVVRNSDNVTLINTENVGCMILSDKFLQISSLLPAKHVYGLGEQVSRLMKDINWSTYTLWNADRVPLPEDHGHVYGSHPFYLAVEPSGKSHGMVLLNSNAMDVVLQPTPAITWRTIGGVFNFVLFAGPSPKEVVSQYINFIGLPSMPPYWSLGFHLCKYGYKTLNETRRVWKTNREAGLPFDVQWNDIDYMQNQNDFTIDPVNFAGLPEFVKEVHSKGMHYVMLFDVGVSAGETPGTYPPFDRGLEMDVFIKNQTDQPFLAKVWNPVSTVFPDFTHPNSTAYWVEMMAKFHKVVQYDGAWIDMNEPSNFVNGQLNGECAPEDLPYRPRGIEDTGLKTKTICMDAKHYAGSHYDWHNLYSYTEAVATNLALKEIRGKRPFIISRSSFVGLGRYAGHWSGDIRSTWDEMRYTIPAILNFNMFGVPLVGADICGFGGDAAAELCKRWMQLGAFYPFSRNHADRDSAPQDPVSLGPEVLEASIEALRLRYTLLPYYYTLFWRASQYGETVVRPMFFEFPKDLELREVDEQFLVGAHVLVAAVLRPGSAAADAVLPAASAWYCLRSGLRLPAGRVSLAAEHLVAVRGGAILVLQEPPKAGPVNTANSHSQPLQLLIVPDANNTARGELFWDDGDALNSVQEQKYTYIQFAMKENVLQNTVTWWAHGVPPIYNITIFAQTKKVESVTVNEVNCIQANCKFEQDTKNNVLHIHDVYLMLDKTFNVKWSYE